MKYPKIKPILTFAAGAVSLAVIAAFADVSKTPLVDRIEVDHTPPDRQGPLGGYADLVEKVTPSVVSIQTSKKLAQRATFQDPFGGDPRLRRFFGLPDLPDGNQGEGPMQSALGSGVILTADGFILTNNHVIAGADEVKVALADGREFESTILLKDEQLDLAVLKIADDAPFPVLSIGDSDAR